MAVTKKDIETRTREAMKAVAKDSENQELRKTLTALRGLVADMDRQEMASTPRAELTPKEVEAFLKNRVKNYRETIEKMKAGGRTEQLDDYQKEIDLFLSFLPRELTEAEMDEMVADFKARGLTMPEAMKEAKQVDGVNMKYLAGAFNRA